VSAARTIGKRLAGKETSAFKYRDLGSMAAVSRRRAVVSFHGIRLHGFLGWLAWLFVHLAFMTGFKNRFTALIHRILSFLGTGRGERAITVDLATLEPRETS
jgi:NADH dehydrogenase